MKTAFLILCFSVLSIGLISPSWARQKSSSLSTDVRFNGVDVLGKAPSAGNAVVQVENEKLLDNLLKEKSHFRDRVKKMLSMEEGSQK
ncbi:MAG: hypothetical protein D6797_00235 [Bdellovibrio sp.]|nr:MAG: hypothetical protein D6797_00235 [Bdellovibrio sp.]